jgi:hypothetical protein
MNSSAVVVDVVVLQVLLYCYFVSHTFIDISVANVFRLHGHVSYYLKNCLIHSHPQMY